MSATDLLDQALDHHAFMSRCVVGLDLSLTATGVAKPGAEVVLTTNTGHDLPVRLISIRDRIERLVTDADLVVIEDLPSARLAGAGSSVRLIGMVHGVVRVMLHERDLQVVYVQPATLKKYITGKGNAPKPTMRMETFKRFGLDFANDNVVDAYGLMAIGYDLLGTPMVQLPAVNVGALKDLRGAL